MGLVKFVLISAINWSDSKLFKFENEPTLGTKICRKTETNVILRGEKD
jgi:hypothetical protein